MIYKMECIKDIEPIEKYYYILNAKDIEQAKSMCSDDLYFDYFGEIKEIKEDINGEYKIVKYDDSGIKQYEIKSTLEHLEEYVGEVASSSFRGEQVDIEYKKKHKWKVVYSRYFE